MLPRITNVFRLAREPELKATPDGLHICKLFLVSSEKYKDKESTFWISGTAFGKTAEFIADVKKGQRVHIYGKIKTEQWESNGEKKSAPSLIIESFEYIEKRPSSGSAATPEQSAAPKQQNAFNDKEGNPFKEEFEEDDIPF